MVKIAIFFHLGNPNLWTFFSHYIANVYEVGHPTDLYISYQTDSPVLKTITNLYPHAIFINSKLGCDIGGQLLKLSYIIKLKKDYDYLLFIHTKSDERWRKELLEPICSSSYIINNIINDFQSNSAIGLIGASKWKLPLDHVNDPILRPLCQQWNIKIDVPNLYFIGGTIFWIRPSIFTSFAKQNNIDYELEYSKCEPGYLRNSHATVTHTWERLFGLLVSNSNLQVIGYDYPYSWQILPVDFLWQHYMVCNPDIARSNYTEHFAVTHYISNGRFEGRKYRLADIGIPYFDWDYYTTRYKDLIPGGINNPEVAIFHYATNGLYEGRRCYFNVLDKHRIKLLAFYFPQFHRIPENDQFWGQGFTEWTLLNRWKPYYTGHQLRLPHSDLGEYDLTSPTVRQKQADLAKKYGIYGFCIYHYWFGNSKKVLYQPAELLLKDGHPNINFCFSWANEPWTRRWDGLESEKLIDQNYGTESEWIDHFNYLLPFFKHPNYIKVDNKPLFLIYRCDHIGVDLLPKMLACWNRLAVAAGINGVYFVSTLGGFPVAPDIEKKINTIVPASVEFHPGLISRVTNTGPVQLIPNPNDTTGKSNYFIASYNYHSKNILSLKRKTPVYFRGLFAGWDNSPRGTGRTSSIFKDFAVNDFSKCLNAQIQNVIKDPNPEPIDNFIFINAWNEWGEQSVLEPDNINNYTMLESIKTVLTKY